jgi:hypothetical protein
MIVWHVRLIDGLVINGANITDGMIITEDQTFAMLDNTTYSADEGCVLIQDDSSMLHGVGAIYDFSTKTFTNPISGEE